METTGRELISITEKDVKKVALGAMRSYYRFRVKAGTPELSSDVRGAGGIIADGYYSFPQGDGKWFLATFEATGLDSKDEVYFKRQTELLLWDSATFSWLITALLFGITHIAKVGWILNHGIFLTCLYILLSVAFFFGFYFIMAGKWRRYRYIYAIEQFKLYHADEQWVAIGENVFTDSQNKYYQELRAQCIRYGIGLITVDDTRKPRLLVTPARREVFDHNRQEIRFFSKKRIDQLKRSGAFIKDQWKKISASIPDKIRAYDPRYLFRFKRSYNNQWVILGISALTIGGVFFRELQQRPVRYLSHNAYSREVIAAEAARGPEAFTLIEPYDTIYIEEYDSTVIPYFVYLQSEKTGLTTRIFAEQELIIGIFDDALINYDCERLYNFQSPKYVVQEGVYPDFETAARRMSQLLEAGLEVNSLWLGCFNKKQNSYSIYFGLLQNTKQEAQNLANNYQKRLKTLQLNANITIRMLTKRE